MEEIKILFFVLGTLFGNDSSRITAEKTTVTINPEVKTIIILQEGLFAFIKTGEDSLNVSRELAKIIKGEVIWRPELADYTTKNYQLYVGDKGKLNAEISLKYTTNEDLKAYALHFNAQGFFSMANFPKDNLATKNGVLDGRYWHFDADKPFSFTLEPYNEMPEKLYVYKKNLLPIWNRNRMLEANK